MMFNEILIDTLKTKLNVTSPTSFENQALPILLEERDMVAKAAPGYGKTLCLCLAAIFKAIEIKKKMQPRVVEGTGGGSAVTIRDC